MRVLMILGFLGLPILALAQVPELQGTEPIRIECNADGTASEELLPRDAFYEVLVSGDLYFCYAEECVDGGSYRMKGNHGVLFIRGKTTVSCRSGDSSFIEFNPTRIVH